MEYAAVQSKKRRSSSVLKTLGRLGLEDDGERDWYEESVRHLNMHFPDWKDLQRTVMIPPAFPVSVQEASLGDITEKRVYDLLEEFGQAYHQPMFVIHSHQFADLIEEKKKGFVGNMKKWNKGEHDFVIIHREYGFIFLQVKSSKCEDGQAFKNAIWQIDKDMKSIKTFLNDCFTDRLPPENMERVLYNYPGFVVMPNCQPTKTSIDPRGVFTNDCKDKESFKKWWDEKVFTSNNRVMNEELYEALLVRFVALRCSSPTISSQIDETHKQIVHFHTPEQLMCMLTAGTEQWWAGPAGSGKTVLLKRKVKELAREILEQKGSEKILVVCFNKPLSVHLKNNFQDWWGKNHCPGSQPDQSPIHVYTYDSFINKVFTEILQLKDSSEQYKGQKFDRRRHDVESYFETHELLSPSLYQYQHIFVDEGQDFHGKKWLDVLRKFHDEDVNNNNSNSSSNAWNNNSNDNNNSSSSNSNTWNNNNNNTSISRSSGYFWVFFDSNQHVQLRENESISWLSNPNIFRLTKVLRNTENIFLLAKTCYSGDDRKDIVLGHREVGLNVEYDDNLMSGKSNGIQIIIQHIRELQRKKVMLRDIVILTKTKDNSLENLPMPHCAAEHNYSEDFVIVVDSIRRFKGLESKIVILYDPPYKLDESVVDTSALLYTAISRCFCYLLIVSTVDGCKAIKERVEKMKYGGKEEADGRGVNSKDWD